MSGEQALHATNKKKRSRRSGENSKIPAMLAVALSSADQVLRDLNSAHSWKRDRSPTNGTSAGVLRPYKWRRRRRTLQKKEPARCRRYKTTDAGLPDKNCRAPTNRGKARRYMRRRASYFAAQST
jgi:hypothetical protein